MHGIAVRRPILTPVAAGTADVTVTVDAVPAAVSVTFDVRVNRVVVPGVDTTGRVTAFSIDGAEKRVIDGVEWMEVDEGGITTADIEVTWTHLQLTTLWDGVPTGGKPDPAHGYIQLWSVISPNPAWLSPAEINQNPGDSFFGGLDVVFATRQVVVDIPAAPKKDPFSTVATVTAKGSTSVSFPHDVDAEEEAFLFAVSESRNENIGSGNFAVRHFINDDEVQGVKLAIDAKRGTIYEGKEDVKFTATPDPPREDLPLEVRYDLTNVQGQSVSSQDYTINRSIGTIPVGREGKHEVTVNLDPNDGNRTDDDLTMHVEVVSYGLDTGAFDDIKKDDQSFTVMDVHKLPKLSVIPESATLMEGNQLELTLTVDRNPRETRAVDPETSQYTTEALSIAVDGSGASGEYSLSETAVAVAKYEHKAGSNWMQSVKVTVEALSDEDVEEDSMLMLGFVVNGTVPANGPRPDDEPAYDAQAALTIQDDTTTLVSVRDDAYENIQAALGTPPMLTTGMSAELMGADLFDYDPNAVSVAYAVPPVDGSAVTASASGGTITVIAASAGEAKVTITATATPKSSSLVQSQTKSNVAQLTFPIMVEDEDLVFMVAGPEDMNLSEGGMGGMVTVTTNRAVTANTEVMLMRDGSSSASDDDYSLTPPMVTIMAGDMSGSVRVMAEEDAMAEEMEMLTLFLVVDGMQMTDKSVSFYIWDAAVPALPIIAQLLLAAFLALGGYRRYRRR